MRGDEFAELYHQYLQRVLNYVRLRVGDEALAQDLTAATFERAYTKRGQLRDVDAFAAWLFRIARNEVAQHYRRAGTARVAVPLGSVPEIVDGAVRPEEAATQRQEIEELLDEVSRLSWREQEIIRLKFAGGLTNRAIAKSMRLSEGNVAVILYRAIRKLRRRLGDGGA